MGPQRSTFNPKPGLARTTTTRRNPNISLEIRIILSPWDKFLQLSPHLLARVLWGVPRRGHPLPSAAALHLNLHSQNLWEWTVAEPCARCVAGQTAHKVPAIRGLLRKQIQVVFRFRCAGIPTRHRMEGMVVTQERHIVMTYSLKVKVYILFIFLFVLMEQCVYQWHIGWVSFSLEFS